MELEPPHGLVSSSARVLPHRPHHHHLVFVAASLVSGFWAAEPWDQREIPNAIRPPTHDLGVLQPVPGACLLALLLALSAIEPESCFALQWSRSCLQSQAPTVWALVECPQPVDWTYSFSWEEKP